MACRLQDNPRSVGSDGVTPELVVLGFRGVSTSSGLIGLKNRSDRPAQDLAGEDHLRSACASAFVC